MRQALRFSIGVAALALAGCGVKVQNQTPTQFQANPDIGMYPISATIKAGALVSQPIYLFQVGGGQKVPLQADASGTQWRAMLPVRCKSSFPVQYLAVWRVQGMATRQKLFPAQPIEVKLLQAPLTKEAIISTSGRPKHGMWQGAVNYEFATEQNTNITGAKIEPVSTSRADVLAVGALDVAELCVSLGELAGDSTLGELSLVQDVRWPYRVEASEDTNLLILPEAKVRPLLS